MAAQQQEEGWPLGLQPLNGRGRLLRNRDFNGSLSFSTTLLSGSSTDSSSDLDTESTGSFFHDKSITLGNLIGISNILSLSRRSTRGRISEPTRNRKNYKSKTWFLSLCSRLNTDAVNMNNNTPSLGHFLEAERRAVTNYRTSPIPAGLGPNDFSHVLGPNSLFIHDQVAPPQESGDSGRSLSKDLLSHDGSSSPLLLSCLCGNLTHS